MHSRPKISVILATKNEEKNIERLLKSLFEQTLPRKYWSVILIDNGSTDNTKQIAKKMLRYVYDLSELTDVKKVRNYRGTQLNLGVKKSHNPIIFFPDADMTFDKRLLEEAVNIFANEDIDALYIPETIVGRGFLGKVRNFERSFYNESSIDAVRMVRKSLFLEIGGFDEKNIQFGPDDWDFNLMVKEKTQKITSTINRIYHHEAGIGLAKYFSKKKMYTYAFDDYIKKWGSDHPDIKRQFSPYYRYMGVFLENGKWKKLLQQPLLALGMFFLRFCVGIIYVTRKLFK